MHRETGPHSQRAGEVWRCQRGDTFDDPGVGSEGGLGLLHEAAGQQLERAFLEAVRPEQAAPNGANVDGTVHRLSRPKQYLHTWPILEENL